MLEASALTNGGSENCGRGNVVALFAAARIPFCLSSTVEVDEPWLTRLSTGSVHYSIRIEHVPLARCGSCALAFWPLSVFCAVVDCASVTRVPRVSPFCLDAGGHEAIRDILRVGPERQARASGVSLEEGTAVLLHVYRTTPHLFSVRTRPPPRRPLLLLVVGSVSSIGTCYGRGAPFLFPRLITC